MVEINALGDEQNIRLCSQIMLVARLVSPRVRILHGLARMRRTLQELIMKKAELNLITAVLCKLTPDQRKRVGAELASLDAQPISTAIVEEIK